MPLWRVFHPEGTFEAVEERQAFAKDITDVYVTGGLPAFYVVVIFIKAGKDTMFRSGELQPSNSKPAFVRIVFDHIARNFEPGRSPRKLGFFDKIDQAMKPHIADKGYEWEIHGENVDINMSRLDGYEMPPEDTEVFGKWLAEDRAVPYEWQPEWKR